MATFPLSALFDVFPPVDLLPISASRALVLVSSAADPMLEARRSAAVLVDRNSRTARVLAEFPGAAQLVLWATTSDSSEQLDLLVTSPGGVLWHCLLDGSITTHDDAFGGSGPALYGHLTCRAHKDGYIYVGGMGNQLYRSEMGVIAFQRMDKDILDSSMEGMDSALYALVDLGPRGLACVGGGGSMYVLTGSAVAQLESGTNAMLNGASLHIDGQFLACGAGGVKALVNVDGRIDLAVDPLGDVYLSDVSRMDEKIYWIAGRKLFSTSLNDPLGHLVPVDGTPLVSKLSIADSGLWAMGPSVIGFHDSRSSWEWISASDVRVSSTS